jgi:16S rRNA (adenine1518-N6/adenine1519-N6)-dimethyltransferase
VILDLLRKYNIRLNKDLGQHFLTDKNILNNIVDAGGVTKDDLIIEIGTGIGTLTKSLAEKAGFVVTIEIDQKLIQAAQDYLKGNDNIEMINQDAMKIDLAKLFNKYDQYKKIKVIANLPYYITSPLIAKILEGDAKPDIVILTIQKEVADRIVSPPGKKQYGSFSIFVNYYSKPEILFYIPNTSFTPKPAVSSAVMKLEVLNKPSVKVKDEKFFFRIVRSAFIQRRKMLKNAIENADIKGVSKALEVSGIDGKRRGETLSIEEFARLADAF